MKVYKLKKKAGLMSVAQWKQIGGCGLSNQASALVGKHTPETNLGELQSRCILAGRELARFAVEHLNKPEWATVEYDIPETRKHIVRTDNGYRVITQSPPA